MSVRQCLEQSCGPSRGLPAVPAALSQLKARYERRAWPGEVCEAHGAGRPTELNQDALVTSGEKGASCFPPAANKSFLNSK